MAGPNKTNFDFFTFCTLDFLSDDLTGTYSLTEQTETSQEKEADI